MRSRRKAHFKPKVFLLADYGFNSYSTLIETRRDLVEKRPDLVQRFVDASAIGWYHYIYGDSVRRQRADQETEPGNDRRAARLFDRQDEGVRHRRFRRLDQARHRRHDRRAHEELLRQDGARRRGQSRARLPRGLYARSSSTRASASICGQNEFGRTRTSFRCATSARRSRAARSRSTASISPLAAANSSRCSDPPAAASRPRCASSPA